MYVKLKLQIFVCGVRVGMGIMPKEGSCNPAKRIADTRGDQAVFYMLRHIQHLDYESNMNV
jgi:hypothetical protein